MLTRIYGTAWPEAWQLKEHKRRMEEAKKTRPSFVRKKVGFVLDPRAGRRRPVLLAPERS
jgi:threonyl-tRNA synthetase